MISVVVPVMNEEENIESLLLEISQISESIPISEIIYIDDGSSDKTYEVLKSFRSKYPALRILRHSHRSGQSTAMLTGVRAAGNDVVAVLDGDGQNDPADIAKLYSLYERNKSVYPKLMVLGERKNRNDSASRRIASRIANRLRSAMLKDMTKDTGCSLKLFRRKDYLNLPYFDHMHRFLPALMMREGVVLLHTDVSHRARQHGISKYGNLSRAIVGISDLFGVFWLQRRPYAFPQINEDIDEEVSE